MKHFRWIGIQGVIVSLLCSFTLEGIVKKEEEKKSQMVGDLEVIKHVLEIEYAPKEWKQSYAGWDLDQAFSSAKNQIETSSSLTTKRFQQIVKEFLGTTKDYHVNVFFLSTEWAELPFGVKGVNGRYFIDWIDTKRLSPSVYSIAVGDELIKFNEQPASKVVEALQLQAGRFANLQTDQSLAEMSLTYRNGERGEVVPKGPISIAIKSCSSGQLHSYQLMWNYHPEYISNPNDLLVAATRSLVKASPKKKVGVNRRLFLNPIDKLYTRRLCECSGIGSYKSFLPDFGSIIWTVGEDSPFYAYIYENDQGNKIGYIRIPHYRTWGSEVECFGEIIKLYEEETDALIIDQVDNPGGFVVNQYFLASMLTDRPLLTPQHRLLITQQDVWEAFEILSILQYVDSDEDAENVFWGSSPFKTHQYVLFLKEYYQFIIDEWQAGRVLTNPIYIEGVDHINPHPNCRYTKPVLILINQLDFSGGDFFPAIMQDNKRATLFGTRTAGAGGYVRIFNFPNNHGIAGFSYTASIAERLDKQPIENLGVTPDVEYQITEIDLQYQYKSYIEKANQAIKDLLVPNFKHADD